ncbi:MAG: hypothetical protein LBI70_02030 [Rickettsiales bacterium]|jgi:hypothetical protein|nr:hypothetical protein [Rickettsiales bacterium]
MSKKEGSVDEPTNVINSPFFGALENLETVPYLNNDGDAVQDILSEFEKNTRGLRMGLITKDSADASNVLDVDFSGNNGVENSPET